MAYTITWRAAGVVWTFHGLLTNEDVIQANLDIYGDRRFDDLSYQIVDTTRVERFDASPEAMEEAASMDEAASLHNAHLLVAVVANSAAALEVAQHYESAMKMSPWRIGIFRSMEDAENWLGSLAG
ncbi:hypothetical protein [Pseudodesulfovibrio indicus]|uniref:hypothetical protein n=1 Tax=Pseudodesulfovibrio indicus TaxID=1716143 RepID=UPI00292DCD4A|nr:hypothetical protein [Pseudodesulfovibrio indicus]